MLPENAAQRVFANRIFAVDSDVTDGGRGANPPLGKLDVKTGPPVSLHFCFNILLVFSRLLLSCVVWSIFPVI